MDGWDGLRLSPTRLSRLFTRSLLRGLRDFPFARTGGTLFSGCLEARLDSLDALGGQIRIGSVLVDPSFANGFHEIPVKITGRWKLRLCKIWFQVTTTEA